MDWKNNRRVQIAIGIAVVALALRWMFGPSLQDATLAYQSPPPEDGNLASPFAATAIIWPIVEVGLAVLAAVGLYAINIGEWLWGLLKNAQDSVPVESSVLGEDSANIQLELARAVATDNKEELAKLAVMIRRPYAIVEMSQSAKDGDYATAESRLSELRSMDVGSSE